MFRPNPTAGYQGYTNRISAGYQGLLYRCKRHLLPPGTLYPGVHHAEAQNTPRYTMPRHGVPPRGVYTVPRHRVPPGTRCLGIEYPP